MNKPTHKIYIIQQCYLNLKAEMALLDLGKMQNLYKQTFTVYFQKIHANFSVEEIKVLKHTLTHENSNCAPFAVLKINGCLLRINKQLFGV